MCIKHLKKIGLFFFLCCVPLALWAKKSDSQVITSDKKRSLKALYNTLDPFSLSQHLAFYQLYPNTEEGKQALSHAWQLLHQDIKTEEFTQFPLPKLDIQAIVSLITRQASDPPIKLNQEQLAVIDKLANHFGNRKLKGSKIWSKQQVLALDPEEIDLSRGLLLFQFDDDVNAVEEIRQYEASIDLMALQISARLTKDALAVDKIREINRFIFQEMQFRFPPHSLYAKDIDLYTFLPSVLDNRQGVCLGVSILYLCIAQRLNLPLEIITPPGHIYVRHVYGNEKINIETTARGIHMPDETYLGLNTRNLQLRNMKEVIGMAFVNQASVYWMREDYQTTVKLYEKALPFLPDDPLLKMLLGINYLFVDKIESGKKLLKQLKGYTFDHAVAPESIPEDYLDGKVNASGIKAIFLPVDETRESIIEKQKELQQILKNYPKFRAGILQLAVTYLQLGRGNEALDILKKYHKIDPSDPTCEYYLSAISAQRLDYNQAWHYLKNAEKITATKQHFPRALKDLRHQLRTVCPEN